MKSFLKYILLFAVSIVLIDIAYGKLCSYLVSHSISGIRSDFHKVCIEDTHDVIIMGSSRASHHYIPSILEDSLSLDCYNAGVDGNGIILMTGVLEMILERYTPKLIIYDVENAFDINIYEADDNHRRYIDLLKPYYKDSKIAEIIKDISPSDYWLSHSSLYAYNSDFPSLFLGYLGKDVRSQKGYFPLFGEITKELEAKGAITHERDSVKLAYIERFILTTKENNVPLIMVASPKYKAQDHYCLESVIELCRENNVTFLDFYDDPLFMGHKEYFKERMHLNNHGASVYTKMLVQNSTIRACISCDEMQ